MVNAIQRHATLILQKSLVEGFGITVAEGLWKSKPMVASAVGGIQDQIVDGAGVLLNDPYDLVAYGDAVASLLLNPNEMKRLGQNAHFRRSPTTASFRTAKITVSLHLTAPLSGSAFLALTLPVSLVQFLIAPLAGFDSGPTPPTFPTTAATFPAQWS